MKYYPQPFNSVAHAVSIIKTSGIKLPIVSPRILQIEWFSWSASGRAGEAMNYLFFRNRVKRINPMNDHVGYHIHLDAGGEKIKF